MKKKIYTTPTLSVEEFEMNEIICSSLSKVSTDDSVGITYGGSDAGSGYNGGAYSKSRNGIWDEE